MPVAQDTSGLIKYFITEHGKENHVLRIPVGNIVPKKMPRRLKQIIKTTVSEAGWQVWRFKHEKCDLTKGARTLVIIRKDTEATPPRDN